MPLTDRQQQIKALLDKGKTPKEIGQQLKISENAVYQQRRRIKQAEDAKAPAAKATTTTKAKAKPGKAKPAKAKPGSRATAEVAAAVVKAADPISEVRRRKAEIDAMLHGVKATLDEATRAYEAAQKAHDTAEAKVRPELERLAAVEALLTGKLAPPKPQRRKPANKTEPAPEAQAPEGAKVEPQAQPVAVAQDEAAEAPDEPTEVPASQNGGGEQHSNGTAEERPGVPSVPEFEQEDAFAS